MKISESMNTGQQVYARELDATNPLELKQGDADKNSQKPGQDRVSLSGNARALQIAQNAIQAAPEVREPVVQDLKKEIDAGTYEVNSEKIAAKLLGAHIDEKV